MKKRTLRNIIQGIYSYMFLSVSFEFILNDHIEKWLEILIFSIMFLIFNWYCFNNGLKSSREIQKEVQEELKERRLYAQCRKDFE